MAIGPDSITARDRELIKETLRKRGKSTAQEIAKRSCLSRARVSQQLTFLINAEIVRMGARPATAPGSRPTSLVSTYELKTPSPGSGT